MSAGFLRDARVVAGKELREIVGAGGGRRGLFRELVFVAVFGLVFPLMEPGAWRSGAVPALFAIMLPMLVAGPHVADSFAGERERRTLETLLATRLPDAAIYLGKIAAVCLYAWGMTALILVASLVALNGTGAGGGDGLFVYSAVVWVSWAAGSAAAALLLAAIGTFVSLRAKTVRGAHQAMMIPLFVLIFGGSFAAPAAWRALPAATRGALAATALRADPVVLVLVAAGLVFVLDAALLAIGVRRFRRDRLISA